MIRPLRAIHSETLRFYDLNGRTARSDYLYFFLFWNLVMALGLTAIVQYAPRSSQLVQSFTLLLGLSILVAPAGLRRLHDTGQSGGQLFEMIVASAAFGTVVLFATKLLLDLFFYSIAMFAMSLFGIVFIPLLWLVLAGVSLVIAAFACFYILAQLTHTFGQMLLPSDPNPNKYGPNPLEVSQ